METRPIPELSLQQITLLNDQIVHLKTQLLEMAMAELELQEQKVKILEQIKRGQVAIQQVFQQAAQTVGIDIASHDTWGVDVANKSFVKVEDKSAPTPEPSEPVWG